MKVTDCDEDQQIDSQAVEIVEIGRQVDKEAQKDEIIVLVEKSLASNAQHICNFCFDTFPARGIECPSHFMCDNCFNNYCQVQIIEHGRNYIHCPQYGCDFDYVGRLGQGMFEQMLSNKRIKNIFSKNCASCKAENSLVLGKYNPQLRSRVDLQCNQCHERTCLFCGDPLYPSSSLLVNRFCANPFRRQWSGYWNYPYHTCSNNGDAKLQQYVCNPLNQVKLCPHCFQLIHKTDGCRNVTCTGSLGCGHSFCYDCLSPTQNHQCPAEPRPSRASRTLSFFLQPVARRISSGIQCLLHVLAMPCRMAHRVHRRSLDRADRLWRIGYPQILTFQGISIYNVPRKAIRGYISSVGPQQVGGMWSTDHMHQERQNTCYRAYRLHSSAVVYLHTHPANVYCNGQSLAMRNPNGILTSETWPNGLSGVSINFNTIQANRIVERLLIDASNDEIWDAEMNNASNQEDYGPGDARWAEVLRRLAEQACQRYRDRVATLSSS